MTRRKRLVPKFDDQPWLLPKFDDQNWLLPNFGDRQAFRTGYCPASGLGLLPNSNDQSARVQIG